MQNQNESLDKREKIRRQLWVAYAAFLVFWGLSAYKLLGEWTLSGELLARRIDGKPYISDFVNVYNAGVLAKMGRSVNIYDDKLQNELAVKVVAPVVPEKTFYLQAPPNFFVACIPLSFFSPVGAWLLYGGIGIALNLLAMGVLAWRYFEAKFARTFVLMATAFCGATWQSVQEGNTSLYLLPPLILFWWLLDKKRFFAAGLATGLLMVKVQYLPFIGLIGLAVGGLRYLGGSLLAGVIVAGVSVAVVGVDNVLAWPHALMHGETASQFSGVAADKMQNLRGMIAALTMHQDTQAGRLISTGVFVLSAFAVAWMWWKKRPESFELGAAISTTCMLLFSIHTHFHDYMLLLPVCLWMYALNCGKRTAAAFPGASWALLLLASIPILPVQPSALYAVALLIFALRAARNEQFRPPS